MAHLRSKIWPMDEGDKLTMLCLCSEGWWVPIYDLIYTFPLGIIVIPNFGRWSETDFL